MDRSSQFGVNILVTDYYEERLDAGAWRDFGHAIGIGQVVNVQESGLIQVLILRERLNHGELCQRIRTRELAIWSHVIKPSIDCNAAGIEVSVQ